MSEAAVPLRRIDHLKFFVGNARQSAYFYRNAFGFDVVGYAGLETGVKNEAAYVLRQGKIIFVLESPLGADHPENYRLQLHGDGVRDIALDVDDVTAAYEETTRPGRGSPHTAHKGRGREWNLQVRHHPCLRRYEPYLRNHDNYHGVFAPGFKLIEPERYSPRTFKPVGLKHIDHIVGNVEEGKMDEWVHFYERVMGFTQLVHFDDKDISTEYSALMSKVVQGGEGRIKFPINEPAKARKRSQIEEYLNYYYGGPGPAHRHGDGKYHRDRLSPPSQRRLLPPRAGLILRDTA